MKKIIKNLLPANIQNFLRKNLRRIIFYYSMRKFLKNPSAIVDPENKILSQLIYGWGNQGFSANKEYMAACIRNVKNTEGPILECGSGLSTLLASIVAHSKGNKYIALENNKKWADKISNTLAKYGIKTTIVKYTPIANYGKFDWYDISSVSIPDNVSLVICDGPPGRTKGGRYGLVPLLKTHFARDCTILLDDVVRHEELSIANKWKDELGAKLNILGNQDSYAKISKTK